MTRKYEITYIANSGVMIKHEDVKLIVDGLHTKKAVEFSRVKEDTLEKIVRGYKPFDDVDYLLFTHRHVDHMCHKSIVEFLKNNDNAEVLYPKDEGCVIEAVDTFVKEGEYLGGALDIELGRKMKYPIKNGEIIFFKSKHMGDESLQCSNICYIIELDGIRFLHLGDGNIDYDYLERMLSDEKINVAFMNFPFMHLPEGKKIIREIIKPDHMVVFHLPFEEDDMSNYIKSTLRRYEKDRDKLPEVEIFIEEGAKVEYIY
ncbi:L-ascorbate metabolism protein UlaG, beta-lactamase superfamily [Dethiosulfatibacter aminovorans DSM 17477]|uniref:L-ascorbate metabolism protein UlaG, beta-lactamase superfamily n=1 Tax=Dethiosulfatibacter aminovorans DSM 17477 TaxID=1121476 RepID=A0A1M6L8U6_9FIRM|nr:MBL fold metallo-hydrolase [Dethiosulfatibacter aminovorans]SHJ67564.1 L-ascorbate metabolism protein UlaG, beta-lactamase superfamily [Dethiosulfatibacter aminovorans DSM 17477]